MTERQLQFRVGLFVLAALVAAGAMVFKFGEIRALWEPTYVLAIHFDSAPGVYAGTPVKRSGVPIGAVRSVDFREDRGGVTVVVDIRERYHLRADSQPRLVRSLLGDSSIEFEPGVSPKFLAPGTALNGQAPDDPMEIAERMEVEMTTALATLNATGREWQQVGQNLNALMDTERGNMALVIERAAESLHQFTLTMTNANETLRSANAIVGDKQNQENLRRTLETLPMMMAETRQTIAAVRTAVQKADENLGHLSAATEPLAQRSTSIVTRLDNTLAHLEQVSSELDTFTQMATKEDGSLQQFVANPDLYRNLNASAASLALLLRNLEPIMQDARVFSDKLARHPELMGLEGYLRGSDGLKDLPPEETYRQSVVPAAGTQMR